MKQQLKAQEGTSLENFYFSVHCIRLNKEEKGVKISCMLLKTFGCTSLRNAAFSHPIWRTSASRPSRLRIRHIL
jgi:hypothetical protein